MTVVFDRAKRQLALVHRGLDMARAAEIFEGNVLTVEDRRQDYGEPRFIAIGYLDGRMVVTVWTPRAGLRRIISLRKANDRERAIYGPQLDGP